MNVRPRLQVLSEEQMNEVHRYSIQILADTGIQVESEEARKIFEKSGGVQVRDGIVYIQEDLINHCTRTAPSSIEIFNKRGDRAFHLGKEQGNNTHFGIGVTNTWFQDIDCQQVELFTRQHMQIGTQLGDLLENYDMISTLGIPSDVSAHSSDIYSALDMYANTSKPLVLLISGENKLSEVLDLLSFLHGDLSSKPFCIPYVNPITPLVLNKTTSDKMEVSIHNRVPLMYSNYSMYGGTTPISEGGTLALLNAELLAGLVYSQLIREGSEIILGSLPGAFNMESMGSQYTPTTYLLNLACAEMMEFYEIPHCGTSGSNSGRGADLLASGDLWLNHLCSCLGKVGCVPFVGGNFDSMAFSPTIVVLSNQIIGEAREFARGFELSGESVNLQEIKSVGPGGDYFTSEQTLAAINTLSMKNSLWSSLSLDEWKAKQKPSAEKDLIEATHSLYAKAKNASEDAMDVVRQGEEHIRQIS